MKILTSASKLVFLAVTLTVCTAYLFGIFNGKIVLDGKDFFALTLMVFTFYFANKGESPTNTVTNTTTTAETKSVGNDLPFLGK